jgi:hypothetical protein
VADTEKKEWTIESTRNGVQAAKDKIMGFLKDLLVIVLHLISRRI